MTARTLAKAALLASTLTLAGVAQAAVLYSQPADPNGFAYASQNDTNAFGNYGTVYDNFTLASGATIGSVDFTGQYFNPGPPGNITAFTVRFWSDNAGQPGSALSTTSAAGNGGEACTGAICTYSVAVNFAAAAGTQYWLSIVPDLGFPPQWGWQSGTGGDGTAYQDFFGVRSQLAADLAFTLNDGAAVPEPAQWAMLLGGFGLLGAALRRRRGLTAVTA